MANNNTTERGPRQVHVDTHTERGPSRVHVDTYTERGSTQVHVDTNTKTDHTTEHGPTQVHVDTHTRTHVLNSRPSRQRQANEALRTQRLTLYGCRPGWALGIRLGLRR
eukprot:3913264-Prymnesium_polylepis.2